MTKLIAKLTTSIFLVGMLTSISSAATFSDNFDYPDFTNSHWLEGTPWLPQTWSHVVLDGADLGYQSTVDNLNLKTPAVMVADNGKQFCSAGLYVETLVRINSHSASDSTTNKAYIGFGTEETPYMAGVQVNYEGNTDKIIYLSVFGGEGQMDLFLAEAPVAINFDTFYKLIVQIDSEQTMDVLLFDLDDKLLGSLSYPRIAPWEKGGVAIGGRYTTTYNNFYITYSDACIDSDNDGYSIEDDCDDLNPLINPGMCDLKDDGIDQDCDGYDRSKGKPCQTVGEGKGKTCFDGLDNDGDGYTDCADSNCFGNKKCQ